MILRGLLEDSFFSFQILGQWQRIGRSQALVYSIRTYYPFESVCGWYDGLGGWVVFLVREW